MTQNTKNGIKSVAVLSVISLIVAALLAVVNMFTAPIIEENANAAQQGSLLEVMPGAKGFEEVAKDTLHDVPSTVGAVYRETGGMGFVILLKTRSSYTHGDDMAFTVGIGSDGKICGIKITAYSESKDFGKTTYPQTYIGKDSALNGIDIVAGVTFSSAAFKNAVSDAFAVLTLNNLVAEGQKSDEQLIKEVITNKFSGASNAQGVLQLTELDKTGTFVKKSYKANNGSGYAFEILSGDVKAVVIVSAFGFAKCYDLEGNDKTADTAFADAINEAKGLYTKLSADTSAADATVMQKFAGADAVLTKIDVPGIFGSVCAAFEIDTNGTKTYGYISRTYGYGNELIVTRYIIDANGAIVKFASDELILHSEYFDDYELNETEYKQGFVGITEGTLTDGVTHISGATITSDAVKTATKDIFAAFNATKK